MEVHNEEEDEEEEKDKEEEVKKDEDDRMFSLSTVIDQIDMKDIISEELLAYLNEKSTEIREYTKKQKEIFTVVRNEVKKIDFKAAFKDPQILMKTYIHCM